MATPMAESRPGISVFSIYRKGRHCIFHWKSDPDELRDAMGLMRILKQQGCENVQLQLESGPEITGLPDDIIKLETSSG